MIAGFYPTPPDVVEIIVSELASSFTLLKGKKVLEPSAGKGDIADALSNLELLVHCCEIEKSLCKKLLDKGHAIVANDILKYSPDFLYDFVVMNPPFEKQQDILHIRKAWELLKPNGKLIAVMSIGWTYGTSKPYKEFRKWLGLNNYDDHFVGGTKYLQKVGGELRGETRRHFTMVGMLPPHSFMKSSVKCTVETCLLILDKK